MARDQARGRAALLGVSVPIFARGARGVEIDGEQRAHGVGVELERGTAQDARDRAVPEDGLESGTAYLSIAPFILYFE